MGSFEREIQLPPDIAPGGVIDAKFKNGLIGIHISRTSNTQEQKVSVDFSGFEE